MFFYYVLSFELSEYVMPCFLLYLSMQLWWNVVSIHETQVSQCCGWSSSCQCPHSVHRWAWRLQAVFQGCYSRKYIDAFEAKFS